MKFKIHNGLIVKKIVQIRFHYLQSLNCFKLKLFEDVILPCYYASAWSDTFESYFNPVFIVQKSVTRLMCGTNKRTGTSQVDWSTYMCSSGLCLLIFFKGMIDILGRKPKFCFLPNWTLKCWIVAQLFTMKYLLILEKTKTTKALNEISNCILKIAVFINSLFFSKTIGPIFTYFILTINKNRSKHMRSNNTQ